MIILDKKRAMESIMARRHPKDGSMDSAPMKAEIVKHEDGEMDGRHQAMQDFMSAHAEKSPMKMMEAMSNFIDLHHAMPKDEGPSEE